MSIDDRERARLAALQRTGLLDSAPEELFDLATALAAKAVNVPVALISLVDDRRQFFKSQCGLPSPWAERRETPLSYSFCQYVSALGEPLIVEDARAHPLVRDNGATTEIGVVAYAGIPLRTKDGFTLGSFCAIDTKPRQWTPSELEILHGFAEQVMAEIELRTEVSDLGAHVDALRASSEDQRRQVLHIVHDLRTPLNALLLGLEGVVLHGSLDPTQQSALDLARRNAVALRELVQRLIEAGTGDRPNPARLSCFPDELVEGALDQVNAFARRAGVTLDTSSIIPLPQVLAQRDEIARVLVNLISNGIKFTPRGGTVRISITKVDLPEHAGVRFSIRDTGIGIAAEDHERIFREGVRLDTSADSRESSGIGLAFCKRVVEEHGSELELQSAVDQGSTFSFTLPLAQKPAAPLPAGMPCVPATTASEE